MILLADLSSKLEHYAGLKATKWTSVAEALSRYTERPGSEKSTADSLPRTSDFSNCRILGLFFNLRFLSLFFRVFLPAIGDSFFCVDIDTDSHGSRSLVYELIGALRDLKNRDFDHGILSRGGRIRRCLQGALRWT